MGNWDFEFCFENVFGAELGQGGLEIRKIAVQEMRF